MQKQITYNAVTVASQGEIRKSGAGENELALIIIALYKIIIKL